jgi:urease gamma subunit
MTIEKENQEKVILKEVALGEKFAVRSYGKALKANLPENIRVLIEHQMEEVRQASNQINLLLGQEGRRLIVHLENDADASRPAETLIKDVELLAEVSQKISISGSDLYQGKGATVLETVISGAFGGALWGGLTGLLVGFGVLQTVSPPPIGFAEILGIWMLTALAFSVLGAFVASGLAFFIGAGISQDDNYQVREIVETHPVLVQTLVGISQAHDKA